MSIILTQSSHEHRVQRAQLSGTSTLLDLRLPRAGVNLLEEIDDLYRDVLSKGAEVVVPISNRSHGHREFVVQTPDGHRIMFGQPIP